MKSSFAKTMFIKDKDKIIKSISLIGIPLSAKSKEYGLSK